MTAAATTTTTVGSGSSKSGLSGGSSSKKSNSSSEGRWFKIPLQVAWKNILQNMDNGGVKLFLDRNEPICVIQANDHASGMPCLRSVLHLSVLNRE